MFGELIAVTPKSDCPHCIPENIAAKETFSDTTVTDPCPKCEHTGENWVCLCCKVVFCSRYVNMHMVEHYNTIKHPIAFSFADFSFWCYECDSYVVHALLDHTK